MEPAVTNAVRKRKTPRLAVVPMNVTEFAGSFAGCACSIDTARTREKLYWIQIGLVLRVVVFATVPFAEPGWEKVRQDA